MRPLLVPGAFLAALALRTKGWRDLPPTAAEATDAWRGLVDPTLGGGFETGRLVAAVAGALAVAVVVLAFTRRDRSPAGTSVALAVAGLSLLDPLGLAAGREAGPGAFVQLAAAFAALLALAPPPTLLGRGLLAGLGVIPLVAALPVAPSPVSSLPADPTVAAWADLAGAIPGGALLLLHHLGYALVPLALAGLARRPGLRLGLGVLAGVALGSVLDQGALHRLSVAAAASPFALALAGLALERLAESERGGRAVLGVAALVAAVNAPTFVSDVRSGQRFPWPIALKRLDDGGGPIHTTLPAPLRRDTDRQVLPLPDDEAALAALLDAGGATLLIPVEGGRAWAAATDDLLATIERRRLATFEVRVKRFDLYRFEVRAFIFPPRR